MAGAVRPGRRVAEVRAGLARPVARPDGAGVRRHLLQPPVRRRHPARGDDRCAGHRGEVGPGALRRHLVVLRGEDEGGGHDRARARDAAADPPAVVLHAQPLDREGSPRRARGAGHGLHRLHRARAGPAHRPVSQRRPRRLARGPLGLDDRRARRGGARPGALPQRDRGGARAEARSARAAVGPAGPARDVRGHRRLQRRAARHQPRRPRLPAPHRRRAGRDRPVRRGVRGQPVGGVRARSRALPPW